MKRYRKILTVLLTVMVLLFQIICNTQVVYAAHVHQQGDNVVYKEAVTLDSQSNSNIQWGWSPSAGMYVYKIDDASGIPTGSVTNGMCFFKYGDNDKFGAIPSSQFIALIVNHGLGLVMSDVKLQAFYSAYLSNISAGGNNKAGSLIDGNGNVLGLCLNDISGCVYDSYPQNTDISIPGAEVNNVYNYYQYYIDVVSPETPDYINLQTYNLNTVSTLLDVTYTYTASCKDVINAVGNGLCLSYYQSSSIRELRYDSGSNYHGIKYLDISNATFYNSGDWNTICSTYGLKQNGDVVGYTKLIASGGGYINAYVVDSTSFQKLTSYTRYNTQPNGGAFTTQNMTNSNGSYALACPNYIPCTKTAEKITIYKDSPVLTQVVNKTYAPSTYTSTTYNNYDTNSDNSISTNSSVVNNSTTTNNEIYNDASESFQEYYSNEENYNIDNSVVINNTTEIIYNYYGDDNGGGGSGGGEGGGGSDDDNDDVIWTALLKAIADFFKKLGELIATVLTGLVTIFTSILTAIATIVDDFSGITDFLGQIFAWLPSEIITLMSLGLTTALFAAFLTWFKK